MPRYSLLVNEQNKSFASASKINDMVYILCLPKMDREIMLIEEPFAAEMTFMPKLAGVVVGLVRRHS